MPALDEKRSDDHIHSKKSKSSSSKSDLRKKEKALRKSKEDSEPKDINGKRHKNGYIDTNLNNSQPPQLKLIKKSSKDKKKQQSAPSLDKDKKSKHQELKDYNEIKVVKKSNTNEEKTSKKHKTKPSNKATKSSSYTTETQTKAKKKEKRYTIDLTPTTSPKEKSKKKSKRSTVIVTPKNEDKKKRHTVDLTPVASPKKYKKDINIDLSDASTSKDSKNSSPKSSSKSSPLKKPSRQSRHSSSPGKNKSTLTSTPKKFKISNAQESSSNGEIKNSLDQDASKSNLNETDSNSSQSNHKREKTLSPKAPSSSSLKSSQPDTVQLSLSFRNNKRQSIVIKDFKTIETEFKVYPNEEQIPIQKDDSIPKDSILKSERSKTQLAVFSKDILKSKRSSLSLSPLRNSFLHEINRSKPQGKVAELTTRFENSRMLKRPSSSNVYSSNESNNESESARTVDEDSSVNNEESIQSLKDHIKSQNAIIEELKEELNKKQAEIEMLNDQILERDREIELKIQNNEVYKKKLEEAEKSHEESINNLNNENAHLKKKIHDLETAIANILKDKTRAHQERSNSVKHITISSALKKESKPLKLDSETIIKSMLTDLSSYVIKNTPTISYRSDIDRRTRVVLEILETEQSYISGLSILMNHWNKPLIEASKIDSKISESDIQKIFADGSLELIFLLNKKLCESINKRLDEWNDKACIGDIFDEWAPRMAPYRRYSSKYEEISNFLVSLQDSNPKFKKLLNILNEHSMNYNGLRIQDYLITPVQRIPRYSLLLRDLISATPDDHPDKKILISALEKISQTATTINETIRQAESQTKMAEIVQRGGGFENLMKGNQYRRFIHKGNVDLLICIEDRKKGSKKQPELLLFNDMIIAGNFVSKKAATHEYAIYVNLLWVIHEAKEIPTNIYSQFFEPNDISIENALILRGPETTWCVGIKDKTERSQWIEVLCKTMDVSPAQLQSGYRKGKHEFLPPLKGIYEGEWFDCKFSGYGTFVRIDGTLFEGHWDHKFDAGYGTITSSGQVKGGWKNNRSSGGDIEVFTEHQFWGENIDLTERDWSLLLTGSKDIIYKKNQVIIEQDVVNSSLYKIKIGKCRVEKEKNGKKKVVGYMSGGTIFGDTSVLPSMKVATARVVSENDTLLQVIEVSILFELLKTSPTLSMKFFRHIALKLAQRLKNLHGFTPRKQKKKTSKEILDNNKGGHSTEDYEFREKFDLPKSEVIIKSLSGILKGVIKKYGILYISQNYVCFESSVFGMTSKDVIELSKVTEIEVNKKKELKIMMKGKKYLFNIDNVDEIHNLILSIWQKAKEEDSVHNDSIGVVDRKSSSAIKRISLEEHEIGGGMTKDDWKKVQQGFKCITYKKDEPVISKGSNSHRIYQIAKGRCRIEISRNSETFVVGYSEAGALLGEIGFLEETEATASVIADEDTDVYVIEGHFINILFVKYPDLAGRFYCYLASILAERLKEREDSNDIINEKIIQGKNTKPRSSSFSENN